MLIAIIGENCVGKSTVAEGICREIGGKIYNGKDFLRLERNPDNSKSTFKAILSSAVDSDNLIYVITEREHLDLLPEGAVNIVHWNFEHHRPPISLIYIWATCWCGYLLTLSNVIFCCKDSDEAQRTRV